MYSPFPITTVFTLAAAAAGASAGFFLLGYDPARLLYVMVAAWLCACALDMGHTMRQGLQAVRAYEQNPVMCAVLRRTGSLRAAAALAIATEAALITSGSFVIMHAWDPHVFGVLCGAAAGIHLSGYVESRRFLRNAQRARA